MIRQRCSYSFPGLFLAERLHRGVRTMKHVNVEMLLTLRCCVVFEYLFHLMGEKNPSFCIQIKGSSANSPKRLTAHFAACEHRKTPIFIAHLTFLSK